MSETHDPAIWYDPKPSPGELVLAVAHFVIVSVLFAIGAAGMIELIRKSERSYLDLAHTIKRCFR